MKINPSKTYVPFYELDDGDVFMAKENGAYLMKTEECYEPPIKYNAVFLETGELHYIDSTDRVLAVDCELVVH